jgi:hypothetical protein
MDEALHVSVRLRGVRTTHDGRRAREPSRRAPQDTAFVTPRAVRIAFLTSPMSAIRDEGSG